MGAGKSGEWIRVAKAIVIVGNESGPIELGPPAMQHAVLASIDVLGVSVVRRTVERLLRDSIGGVAVCGSSVESEGFDDHPSLTLFPSTDPWETAAGLLAGWKDDLDCVLIMRVGAYIEFDLADAFRFCGEHSQGVVRAFDDEGPLDLWVARPDRVSENASLFAGLQMGRSMYYPVRGYVNRLRHPRDLRRLVVDSFNSRCLLRPQGSEVRQGIWMGEGAQVGKGARIVSPSFIGRDVTISEQCLVTRCSNIERDSFVDYGTVVEDTSILPNSYVGIGLDLAHSVVDGQSLVNLHHGVMLKIGDPVVMRQNKPFAGVVRNLWSGPGLDGPIVAAGEQSGN